MKQDWETRDYFTERVIVGAGMWEHNKRINEPVFFKKPISFFMFLEDIIIGLPENFILL